MAEIIGPGTDKFSDFLISASDLFLNDPHPSEESREHYSVIAIGILDRIDDRCRQVYAEKVAHSANLPLEIARNLADCDNSDVARAILALSPVLSDDDLADLALRKPQAHLHAISERAVLSEPVTDVLVDRGDQSVLLKVSDNAGALFSDKGFNRLLARGGHNPAIVRNLSVRRDFDRKKLERVVRILDLLAKSGHKVSFIDAARHQRDELDRVLASVAVGHAKIDDALGTLARNSRAYHLAEVLARFGSVSVGFALNALMKRDIMVLAALCRIIGIEDEAFLELVLFRGRRLRPVAFSADQFIGMYRNLDRREAERLLSASTQSRTGRPAPIPAPYQAHRY